VVAGAPRLVVAGTHSGVGKTTVASGLVAALAARGLRVAPFKVGPDFIDPSYHALAAGRPGRNLDPFLCGEELVRPLFLHGARGADLAVVEGVMGLFDGEGGGDFASTAHVARLLGAPVLLVVDASAMARSAAAVVHGYSTFDPRVRVGGVVLNRVGSDAHERMLREALSPLGVPVLGALRRDGRLAAPERHLGLVPAAERRRAAGEAVRRLGEVIGRRLDLEGVLRLARSAGPLEGEPWSPEAPGPPPPGARVAVASGPAFSFLYEENLELLRGAGAELLFFDPASSEGLPEGAGALYLGGGFPEVYAAELSENRPLREAVRLFAAAGRPVVAECGGLLYLARSLDGREMCGVLDAGARMTGRLTLGYRRARALSGSSLAEAGTEVRGHEFHYSAVEPAAGERPAWEVEGRGPEGFVAGGVHASYLHLHWAARPQMPRRLVRAAAGVGA